MKTSNGKGFWNRLFKRNDGVSALEKRALSAPVRPDYITTVTADDALRISAVFRAVSILSTYMGQLPVGVWRNGSEVANPGRKVASLIERPNYHLSQSSFMKQTTVSLATSGNAYWRLYRSEPNASGIVENIQVLNAHNVTIEIDLETGKRSYGYFDERGTYRFEDWQIKHLRLFELPGYEYGLGPIQQAQTELTGVVDTQSYAGNWFRESGIPNGILRTDQPLPPGMHEQYAEQWDDRRQGYKTKVLSHGLDYKPMVLAPRDAQFLEVQQFNVTSIARLFGVPAAKLLAEVNGNSMTYQNLSEANTDFIRDTLSAYIKVIEEALTDLIPRGQSVRFKVEALLRADQKTRYETHAIAIDKGIKTVNEVRAEEGLPPIDEPTPKEDTTKTL
ncbi:phage portal protein [Streptomyces turgidiscabies]|nr:MULTISPECIES: phage portal protein [Streptomyces]MDX3498595.1 phage portal protein [Streptomyces turgidiscabies]